MKISHLQIVMFMLLVSNLIASTIQIPNDFNTIQAGIDYASNGDTVLIDPGTYYENIDFTGKNIVVGSHYLTSEDTAYIPLTIIDGNEEGRVVFFHNGENSDAELCGLTIRNGSSNNGGGICCFNSSPTLRHLVIKNNYSSQDGGGIFISNSTSEIEHCVVRDNSALYSGGGIALQNGFHAIIDVELSGNLAGKFGGGLNGSGGEVTLNNATIIDNTADTGGGLSLAQGILRLNNVEISSNEALGVNNTVGFGGGVYIIASDYYQINRALISKNITHQNGGGITSRQSVGFILNTTIADNSVITTSPENIFGGGVWASENIYEMIMINSILWGNTPGEIQDGNIMTVLYSDVSGGRVGEGNLNMDPSFVDPQLMDYNLQSESPCIDAGTNSYYIGEVSLIDLDPDEYFGVAPDMGVYEYQSPSNLSDIFINGRSMSLKQNFPNPFNPSTSIQYELATESNIQLTIIDISGREVIKLVSEFQTAGMYVVTWNGLDQSGRPVDSGIYLVQLSTNSWASTVKMVYQK
ncbi:MAG: T9SS type A sorting domain-containing protein [Candidatus Marinimicrobia bacterium]|nr:T9SS type A sorting domain-containing protein [Candidatus Neomarinimicrobiota bacterium]